MKLELLERDKNQIKIRVIGETHTLLNLLRENSWKKGAEKASYIIKHPYMSYPEITIKSANPLKTLTDAATEIESQSKELAKELKRILK